MAYNYTAQADGVGIPFNYTRGNPLPLDSWSLFMNLAAAESYAKTNPVSYPGQLLTVVSNEGTIAYLISAGSDYTQVQKDLDDEWYADESENHATFLAEHEMESYTPTAPEDTEVGTELKNTRTLIRLGTKSEIESASASAVINWLNANGQAI